MLPAATHVRPSPLQSHFRPLPRFLGRLHHRRPPSSSPSRPRRSRQPPSLRSSSRRLPSPSSRTVETSHRGPVRRWDVLQRSVSVEQGGRRRVSDDLPWVRLLFPFPSIDRELMKERNCRYYSGRTAHIHFAVRKDYEIADNGYVFPLLSSYRLSRTDSTSMVSRRTIIASSGTVEHVGQLFFSEVRLFPLLLFLPSPSSLALTHRISTLASSPCRRTISTPSVAQRTIKTGFYRGC